MAYIIACAVRVPLPRLQSGWGIAYIMASAVHVPLPRFELGVGHCLYNGLRCAHAAASV